MLSTYVDKKRKTIHPLMGIEPIASDVYSNLSWEAGRGWKKLFKRGAIKRRSVVEPTLRLLERQETT
jgi:hypothetical protein